MSRYEQPRYTVESSRHGYEIRRYESYIAAETVVAGKYGPSGSQAFRRLAGFIFGRNTEALRMNMTVPVTHQSNDDGTHRYRFVMESAYSEESLPDPLDDTVAPVRVPAGLYAVRSYSGGRSDGRFRRAQARLLTALAADGMKIAGTPSVAVCNGPATPAPLRRNEVIVPVALPKEQRPRNTELGFQRRTSTPQVRLSEPSSQ